VISRIGRYDIVVALESRGVFFEVPAEAVSRTFSGEPCPPYLIKLFPQTRELPAAVPRETHVLRSIRSLHVPRLVGGGLDQELCRYYYEMELPAPLRPLAEGPPSLRACAAVADALQALHDDGIAYRNFACEAIAFTASGRPILYDIHRVRRFDATRLVEATAHAEAFDPPEARIGAYDTVRADMFGFGCWLRSCGAQWLGERAVAGVLERLTAQEPRDRPNSMGQIAELLRRSGSDGTEA